MSDYNPNIEPIGHRCLVFPVKTQRQTEGGIYIPEQAAEREDMAQVKGVLVAVGPTAGKDYNWGDWARIGETVIFGKYSGVTIKGDDGKEYRLINDEDLAAYKS